MAGRIERLLAGRAVPIGELELTEAALLWRRPQFAFEPPALFSVSLVRCQRLAALHRQSSADGPACSPTTWHPWCATTIPSAKWSWCGGECLRRPSLVDLQSRIFGTRPRRTGAGWLKPENRCLVPFNSFSEYAPEPTPENGRSSFSANQTTSCFFVWLRLLWRKVSAKGRSEEQLMLLSNVTLFMVTRVVFKTLANSHLPQGVRSGLGRPSSSKRLPTSFQIACGP
jgi:hypothetical protein